MDNLTQSQRRKNMRNIRSKDTKPERMLASALRAKKIYFGKNLKSIIGKPDFVIRKKRLVIFVDSEFWHGHPTRFIKPKTNYSYWRQKIKQNKKRDKQVNLSLRKQGWKVLRFWEHEIKKDAQKCVKKVLSLIGTSFHGEV